MSRQYQTSDLSKPGSPGTEDAQRFGKMVRSQRMAQGLRQEDVASATGVGRRYIVEMEAGKPTLRIGPALMIARFLGIIPVVAHPERAMPEDGLPEISPDNLSADLPPLKD